MNDSAENDNRETANVFHHRTKEDRAQGIDHTEADHDETDLMHTQRTSDIGLREIGANECLLHANEDGDGDEELQIWFLHLTERGREQLQAREFCCRVGTLALLTVTLEGIQKEGNDANGGHNARQVDHRDFKDFIIWGAFQVAMAAVAAGAEVGATELQILLADGRVAAAAAAAMCAARQN